MNQSNELYHYGVEGMKWGVRKAYKKAAKNKRYQAKISKYQMKAQKMKYKMSKNDYYIQMTKAKVASLQIEPEEMEYVNKFLKRYGYDTLIVDPDDDYLYERTNDNDGNSNNDSDDFWS